VTGGDCALIINPQSWICWQRESNMTEANLRLEECKCCKFIRVGARNAATASRQVEETIQSLYPNICRAGRPLCPLHHQPT
jgi:hypothetical protein